MDSGPDPIFEMKVTCQFIRRASILINSIKPVGLGLGKLSLLLPRESNRNIT
jgi:hypothetical protein